MALTTAPPATSTTPAVSAVAWLENGDSLPTIGVGPPTSAFTSAR